jgi:Tol biopolymer transport system component
MMLRRLLDLLLVGMLITACQADQAGSQAEPPMLAPTATDTAIPTGALPSPSTIPTRIPPTPPMHSNDPPPTAYHPAPTAPAFSIDAPPIDLPAPLLVQMSDTNEWAGLWLFDGQSNPTRLAYTPEVGSFDLAPDRTRALYFNTGDIWLLDIVSGESRQVTPEDDPASYLFYFHWWPTREGFVTGTGEDIGMCSDGFLTYVSLDGEVEILDDTVRLSSDFAVSPDGQTVAYWGYTGEYSCQGVDNGLYLYHVGGMREEIDLAAYGLMDHNIDGISWSPDGTKLGLVTTTYTEGADRLDEQIVILDLTNRTSQTLREFGKYTTGSDSISAPVWSDAGDWLVFSTMEWVEMGQPGIFALWYADTDSVRRLTPDDPELTVYGAPAISPDDQWVAVPGYSGITFVRISDGAVFLWAMPVAPYQVDWVTLP